jgi:G3E family GTPase
VGGLLQEQGESIYRMKGVVALDGHERKFVMQAVHCMFNGDFGTEWSEQRGRASKLVLIGENLDEQALRDGFDSCLAG